MRGTPDKESVRVEEDKEDANSFSLPFIGSTKAAQVHVEPLPLKREDGSKRTEPIRIFRDQTGNWIRLEYSIPEAQFTPMPVAALEKTYASIGEKITSVASGRSTLSPSETLDKVSEHIDLSKATAFRISRVRMIQGAYGRESSWIMAEVFGVRKAWDDLPEEPIYRRVRLSFNLDTGVIMEDAHL